LKSYLISGRKLILKIASFDYLSMDNIDQPVGGNFPADINPGNNMFNQPNGGRQPEAGKKKYNRKKN